ncbi:MAG: M24 family metallopeptidase [Phycisphaerales bacterium]|nr:M24 family metallopeptidase [Phycisphaerales bacterium]
MLDPLAGRRARIETAWSLDRAVVLVGSGRPIPVPGGADRVHPFQVHPDYRWLTERRMEGGVLAFDPRSGWTLFEPEATEAERLWEGRTDVPSGRPLAELDAWIDARSDRPLACLGAGPWGERPITGDAELERRLATLLLHARRPKDEREVRAIRSAADATAAGFARALDVVEPGVSERHVQIEIETAMFHAGAQTTAYGTIVGSGPNSAVLHATPSGRTIGQRDLVLIDAGAAIDGYCADVTRTLTAAGTPSAEQRVLLETVERAQQAAIACCRAGTEWRAVHQAAALVIAEGLVEAGLLKGRGEDRLDDGAIALFFPHGVGHMVGMGVRDAGGPLPGRDGLAPCCGVRLRVDLPLEAGYVMTVEPGAYIVPALLRDAARRKRHADVVNWSEADRWTSLGVGGVRIEDNILVTDGAPEVLTASIPH